MPLNTVVPISVCFYLFHLWCFSFVQAENIHFHVHPQLGKENSQLQVSFDFRSDGEGMIQLRYENNSWGDRDLFNCVKNLDVQPQPISIERDPGNSTITIKTSPHTDCRISYGIGKDYDGVVLNQHRYRPIVEETYFHILGMRLFLMPTSIFESETSRAKIEITWAELPADSTFHCSFGPERHHQVEVTREELYATYFVGGDFRKYSFRYRGEDVYFLTRGKWEPFNDDQMFQILKETISFQNEFWEDPRRGTYSVCLLPTYEPWTPISKSTSVGGSGLTRSFISFASNNPGSNLEKMRWLYNHELLHKWIGRTIQNENEVQQYWFSEGFTEYYTFKLLLKSGRIDVEEFVRILSDEMLGPHFRDPVNAVPNATLTMERYWSEYKTYGKLPYRRGLLYAFMLDTQIKRRANLEKSLDHMMQRLLKMALDDDALRFNHEIFKSLLSDYLDPQVAMADFDKYIVRGELIDFQEKLPAGLEIDTRKEVPTFKILSEDRKDLLKFLSR